MNPVEYLTSVGIDIMQDGHNSYKLSAEGFMDLTVETWITTSNDGKSFVYHVSMCHYFEANGDLVQDPEIEFSVKTLGLGNKTGRDWTWGQVDYQWIQQCTGNFSRDQEEIKDFMECMWIPNLKMQGHKLVQ